VANWASFSQSTADIIQRVLILWIMALLVVYGNNATLVAEDISAMRTTVGAFMAARLTVMCVYIIASFASFQHRPQVRLMAGLIFISLLIWIPLYFEIVSIRAKIAVAVVGIVFEEASWILAYGPWIKKKLSLQYSTAVDITHEIDRFAAFFIIVLGEYLYSIIVGNPAAIGLNSGLLKAVWTLVIAFSLNWIYSVGDGSMDATHPIRRSAVTAFTFFSMHLPLAASLLVGGHVCAASAGLEELETGERWLLGGGLGVGMFCLWFLGMLYKSKDTGCLIMPKTIRIGMRLIVAVILVLLPITSKDQLNPVQLLSIVMALFAFTVIWETVGGLQKGARIYEKWDGRNMPLEEDGELGGEKSKT
jgi:low temperature requirement protein LtrA